MLSDGLQTCPTSPVQASFRRSGFECQVAEAFGAGADSGWSRPRLEAHSGNDALDTEGPGLAERHVRGQLSQCNRRFNLPAVGFRVGSNKPLRIPAGVPQACFASPPSMVDGEAEEGCVVSIDVDQHLHPVLAA